MRAQKVSRTCNPRVAGPLLEVALGHGRRAPRIAAELCESESNVVLDLAGPLISVDVVLRLRQ